MRPLGIALTLLVCVGFSAAAVVSGVHDRSAGSEAEDIAGGDEDEALIDAAKASTEGKTETDATGEALSLDRYYSNLPEYIYGHCAIQPNPSEHELNDFIWGSVDLRQSLKGGDTVLYINMTGFNATDSVVLHGFHVHEFGDLSQGCGTAGGHYDPFGVVHGSPYDSPEYRHFGDLGNVQEMGRGVVTEIKLDSLVSLLGPFSVLGRSIVIHEKADDLGRGQDEESLLRGNTGKRLACCTVGLSDGSRWDNDDWEPIWAKARGRFEADLTAREAAAAAAAAPAPAVEDNTVDRENTFKEKNPKLDNVKTAFKKPAY